VEVDGASHQDAERRDARRDAVLARAGYRVLRLSASLVSQDPHEAIRLIRSAL